MTEPAFCSPRRRLCGNWRDQREPKKRDPQPIPRSSFLQGLSFPAPRANTTEVARTYGNRRWSLLAYENEVACCCPKARTERTCTHRAEMFVRSFVPARPITHRKGRALMGLRNEAMVSARHGNEPLPNALAIRNTWLRSVRLRWGRGSLSLGNESLLARECSSLTVKQGTGGDKSIHIFSTKHETGNPFVRVRGSPLAIDG